MFQTLNCATPTLNCVSIETQLSVGIECWCSTIYCLNNKLCCTNTQYQHSIVLQTMKSYTNTQLCFKQWSPTPTLNWVSNNEVLHQHSIEFQTMKSYTNIQLSFKQGSPTPTLNWISNNEVLHQHAIEFQTMKSYTNTQLSFKQWSPTPAFNWISNSEVLHQHSIEFQIMKSYTNTQLSFKQWSPTPTLNCVSNNEVLHQHSIVFQTMKSYTTFNIDFRTHAWDVGYIFWFNYFVEIVFKKKILCTEWVNVVDFFEILSSASDLSSSQLVIYRYIVIYALIKFSPHMYISV